MGRRRDEEREAEGSTKTVSGCRLEWGDAGSPGRVGVVSIQAGGGAGGDPEVDVGLGGLGSRAVVRLQACERQGRPWTPG